MIGFLQGKIIQKNKNSILLLAGAVGYEIHISTSLSENLSISDSIEIFIYTKVREDEISLYGFATGADLEFFRLLISVSGVGPKTALEFFNHDVNQIKNAILQENAVYLSKIPGIGKKTAERIILDLKNKVLPDLTETLPDTLDQHLEEVTQALMGLGYQRGEIYRILKTPDRELISTEEMVTYFLQHV